MTDSVTHGLDKKAVGIRIREIRGKRTQKEFAEIANATQSYISDLERGKCFPSVSFLALLVELSGKSYDWILTGKERVIPTEEEPDEENKSPPKVSVEMDYSYLQSLIILIRDAPPSEKPRLLKILISYLLTYL